MGFTKTTFARDALGDELQGIQAGLELAFQYGFKKLVLFSDCKKVVQLLDQEVTQTNIYTNVLCKCRELGTTFEDFKVRHCQGQDNTLVDRMAKYCMAHEDPQICNSVASIFTQVPSYCIETYVEEGISNNTMVDSEELFETMIEFNAYLYFTQKKKNNITDKNNLKFLKQFLCGLALKKNIPLDELSTNNRQNYFFLYISFYHMTREKRTVFLMC